MDLFQRLGNFFTGSGWVSDDEKRRKQAQQNKPAAPKPQQKLDFSSVQQRVNSPAQLFGKKDGQLDAGNQAKKPVQSNGRLLFQQQEQSIKLPNLKIEAPKAPKPEPAPAKVKPEAIKKVTSQPQPYNPRSDVSPQMARIRQQLAPEAEKKKQEQAKVDTYITQYGDTKMHSGRTINEVLKEYNSADAFKQKEIKKELNSRASRTQDMGDQNVKQQRDEAALLLMALDRKGDEKKDIVADTLELGGNMITGITDYGKNLLDSASVIANNGKTLSGEVNDYLYRSGKITKDEYIKRKSEDFNRLEGFSGSEDKGLLDRVLRSGAAGAEGASYFIPASGAVKATKSGAAAATKDALKEALLTDVAEQMAANSVASGASAFREGVDTDIGDILNGATAGGVISAVAHGGGTLAGNAARRLGSKADDLFENGLKETNRLGDAAAKVADDIPSEFPAKKLPELPESRVIDLPRIAPLAVPDFEAAAKEIADTETASLNKYISEHKDVLSKETIQQMQETLKKRIAQLTDELKARHEGTVKTVDEQGAATAEATAAKQAEVQAAQEAQAATVTPDKGEATAKPKGNAEVEANDAFNKAAGLERNSSDITYIDAEQGLERLAGNKTMEDLVQRQGFRVPTSINKQTQGAAADAISNTAGTLGGQMLGSQNPLASFFGNTLFAFNKKATLNNPQKALVEQVRGRQGGVGNLRNDVVRNIEAPLRVFDAENAALAKSRVFSAFELYNNGDTKRALKMIKSFVPEERAYFDSIRELNTIRNNLNRATMDRGLIDQYDNGMHMPRIYDIDSFRKEFSPDDIESFAQANNRVLDLDPMKRRKQLEDISQALYDTMLRDPAQASMIRTEIALHNKAISEYSAQLGAIPGVVSDVPQRGFLAIPDQARYGELRGKHVRRDLAEPMLSGDNRFKSDAYRAVNTLLNSYQATVLGKAEQALRKTLTIYNPATRLGNRAANLSQGAMAGFNLPEMAISQQHFMNVLKNGGDEWTRLAKTFGAIDNNDAFARMSGNMTDPQSGLFVGTRQRLSQSYQDVDTAAKVAMFKWQIQRGASPEDAARFVNRALPNIGNSGEIYSFFSRLPVLGAPFRAIQPEVLRALSSTASRNTVPFVVAMTLYTTLQNYTWADVPEEDRKQIQERFGSGQTPFAGFNKFMGEHGVDTSKVLPSSWSINAAGIPGIGDLFAKDPDTGEKAVVDVDPRRLMGVYSINLGGDSAADGLIDQVSKAAPMNIPVGYNDGKFEFQPQNIVGNRLFQPLWQAAIDKDFRGKSVQNPDMTGVNVVDPETGKPLDTRTNPMRAAEYVLRSYVPQITDVANVADAAQGKENFYGQEMNVAQAIGRLFGLKGEQFNQKHMNKMDEQAAYFEDKATIDKQREGMSPNEQQAWKRLTGYDKLNEKKPNAFGGESWVKAAVYNFSEDKWKDYASNPRLYELMVQKKVSDHERTKQQNPEKGGQPIQPEFDGRLSESFRKQLIQNKMVAPGDDAELDQRMYADPEWDYYQRLKDEYSEASKKYYGESDGEFTDELVKHQDAKFPAKPDVLKAYSEAYGAYANGQAPKPEFTDAVKAAKEAYNMATLKWTNDARKARGLPAITWDVWNNPTFGFDSTPSGYGYGRSGGGGGYNSANHVNTLSRLTNYSDSVKRLDPVKIRSDANLVAMFNSLLAGSGGGRRKPTIGAGSRGA